MKRRSYGSIANRARILEVANRRENPYWSTEEIELLKKYYPIYGKKCSQYIPTRDEIQCRNKAKRLHIKANSPYSNKWSDEEKQTLKTYYPIEGGRVIDRLPGKTSHGIQAQVSKLGIVYKGEYNKEWTEDEINTLKENYPKYGAEYCSSLLGRSAEACVGRARILGLKVTTRKGSLTNEEKDLIKQYYETDIDKLYTLLPDYSKEKIQSQANKMGIKRKTQWTEEEKRILTALYPIGGWELVHQSLPLRDEHQIRNMARRLNVKVCQENSKSGKYNCKKVQCIETSQIFCSASQASRTYNITVQGILCCCENKYGYKTAGGYHWKYVDEDEN